VIDLIIAAFAAAVSIDTVPDNAVSFF